VCSKGHDYPVVDGVPVLLVDSEAQTIPIAKESLRVARAVANGAPYEDPFLTATLGINDEERRQLLEQASRSQSPIDPVVRFLIGATNGIMYLDQIGKVGDYAIPELRLPPGNGQSLIDLGCNWGRWSIAAARLGYRPIGIDPSLGSVLAARRICKQMGLKADFIVGDARFLPFADKSIATAFSYSVLQHFSKQDARLALEEVGRVLSKEGTSLIQMPNSYGIRCFYHQLRRGFRATSGFDVRYYTPSELVQLFESTIGPTKTSVDCFFGIGLQLSDIELFPVSRRIIIRTSEALRRASESLPVLKLIADSLYLRSVPAGR
jgi:SAM-dependent methyltransferase